MTVRMLRTSERMAYKRCRWRWDKIYNKKMHVKVSKPALRFGSLVHAALAEYYQPGRRRGPHPARTFQKLYKVETARASSFGMRDAEEEWHEAGALGVAMLKGYVERFGADSGIVVIEPEHSFRFRFRDSGGVLWLYVGRFDALVRYKGEVALLEHKTAKAVSDEYLQLDEQAGSYWAFAPMYLRKKGILKPGQDLDMILYNFLRKAMPDERPQNTKGQYLNKDGTVSKKQPSPYFERVPVYRDEPDRRRTIKRIKQEAWEMRMAHDGKLPIYKNPTRTCSWDCPLYHMCELHETGSDWKEFGRQNFERQDPYSDYLEAFSGNKQDQKRSS